MAIEQGSTSINPHPNPNPDPDPNPDPNTNPNPNRTLCMEKYELGEILGRGNNSVVKLARNILTGDKVAIKIFDKEPLLRGKKMWIRELTKKKIKQEISIQRMVKHPNVVSIIEVMATKEKIYVVMEHLAEGELFDKICKAGLSGMNELQAQKYFHQLIRALDHCHSKGVFHRDIRPENLLVGHDGVLKLSYFGLSALSRQASARGLFHAPYGTPPYAAPEVTRSYGYEGPKADIWASGVTLFFMVAGKLPFIAEDRSALFQKIREARYTMPYFFSGELKNLIKRMLDPNPATRITIAEIYQDMWFMWNYEPLRFPQEIVGFGYNSSDLPPEVEVAGELEPEAMNAFEMSSTSMGFNLIGNLFTKVHVKWETRFISNSAVLDIIGEMEYKTTRLGFDVKRRNFQMNITRKEEAARRKGHLFIVTKIFEMAPSFYMVVIRKVSGDNLQFHEYCKQICAELGQIVWKVEPLNPKGTTVPIRRRIISFCKYAYAYACTCY